MQGAEQWYALGPGHKTLVRTMAPSPHTLPQHSPAAALHKRELQPLVQLILQSKPDPFSFPSPLF